MSSRFYKRSVHPSTYNFIITIPGKHAGKSYGEVQETYPQFLEFISGSTAFPDSIRIAAAKTAMGESIEGLGLPTTLVKPIVVSRGNKPKMWIEPKGTRVGLQFPVELKDKFKAEVDGWSWDIDKSYWTVPTEQIVRVIGWFGGTDKVEATDEVKLAYNEEIQRRKDLDIIRNKVTSDIVVPTLLPLREYQKVNIEFAFRAGGRVIIADAPGLGKTPTAIGFALLAGGKTLMVLPKSVKLQWAAQVMKFAGFDSCVWHIKGPTGNINSDWHIINYDLVAKHSKLLNEHEFTTIICDEATKLKNYKSKRYIALFGGVIDTRPYPGIPSKYLLKLTGTPMMKRPRELYTLLSALNKKRFYNPKVFIDRYEGESGKQGQNLGELHERTKELMIRHTKDVVKDELPKKDRTNLIIEMTDEEMKRYNKALNMVFSKWSVQMRPSATQMPILRDVLFEIKFPRIIEWIDEMLEAERSVLVFSLQQKHAERIAAHYGTDARLWHGSIKEEIREQNKQDLITKKARVGSFCLLSGGTGVDGLQEAMSDALFVDRWYIPSDHEQAEDRLSRLGQTEPCMNYYMTVKGTYDEDMAEVLESTQQIIDAVIDGKMIMSDKELSEIEHTSIFNQVAQRMAAKRSIEFKAAIDDVEEILDG